MPFEYRPNFDRSDFVEAAVKKADAIIERDSIKMADFTDMYGDRVQKDEEHLARVTAGMEQSKSPRGEEGYKFSRVLEALIHEAGGKFGWFGKGVSMIKTSRFDDVVCGIDEVVEFKSDQIPSVRSFLGLGIDVTYSQFIDKKLRRVKDEIESGNLATLRYFKDPKGDFRGELKTLPHVVLGVDGHTVKQLAQLWLESERMDSSRRDIERHEVQWQILEEIEDQCRAFGRFAEHKGKADIAQRYRATRDIIASIMDAKKRSGLSDSGRRDGIFYALQVGLRDFRV
jgi:hypothetical protein